MTVSKQFNSSRKFPAIRLRLTDLPMLSKLIFEDTAGERAQKSIMTSFGVTQIASANVNDFVDDADAFPDELYAISIRGTSDATAFPAVVETVFEANRSQVTLKLSDRDESRLLGRERKIADWLLARRAWYGYWNIKPIVAAVDFIILALSVPFLFAFIKILQEPRPWHYIFRDVTLLVAVPLLIYGTAYFSPLWRTMDVVMPQVTIEVRPPHRPITRDNVSALATIIGLILAVVAFFH